MNAWEIALAAVGCWTAASILLVAALAAFMRDRKPAPQHWTWRDDLAVEREIRKAGR